VQRFIETQSQRLSEALINNSRQVRFTLPDRVVGKTPHLGEMASMLVPGEVREHPYGLQDYRYIATGVIAIANFAFGALYIYSLGVFNEGSGSFTASMRYLKPTLNLIVAVTLEESL